jgi:hypothetical protein
MNPNRLTDTNLYRLARDTSREELQRQAYTGMTHPDQRGVLVASAARGEDVETTSCDARLTLRAANDVFNDRTQSTEVRTFAQAFVLLRRADPTDADRALFAMELRDATNMDN